jgi:aquaporin Z
VNPARSLGVAWFAGGEALGQVWVFLLAPVIGAAIAGISHALIVGDD